MGGPGAGRVTGVAGGRGRVWQPRDAGDHVPPQQGDAGDAASPTDEGGWRSPPTAASPPIPDLPPSRPTALVLARLLQAPAAVVAPRLLGAFLTHEVDGEAVRVRLTEVEAYDEDDPASHTFRGPTRRNRTMFEAGGHLYTYRSHGIHVCANVVCDEPGRGSAVLLRGGVVVGGRAVARRRRGGRGGDDWLAAGPGRLCAATGIELDDDGAWLLGGGLPRLELATVLPTAAAAPRSVVMVGPRVGVSQAPDRPWRWWLADAHGVSAYRRSPRADR